MGHLIVIEGSDCSGKSTQFALLKTALEARLTHFKTLRFPRYDRDSSALVRAYLNGDYGTKPSDVNAYAATAFFAVDRVASYRDDWGQDYENGAVLLADRYTTSNAVHQGSKLEGAEKDTFLTWLFDFEYEKLALPKPDLVFFLDMPTAFSAALLDAREGKKSDIHEQDSAYLNRCYEIGLEIASSLGWHKISCVENGKIRSVEDIHKEILAAATGLLGDN